LRIKEEIMKTNTPRIRLSGKPMRGGKLSIIIIYRIHPGINSDNPLANLSIDSVPWPRYMNMKVRVVMVGKKAMIAARNPFPCDP